METVQIVLIEDNPADTILVKLALEGQGLNFNLVEFPNGADAVEALCQAKSGSAVAPDAVLLDLNTPKCDGFDVLSKLRNRFPLVPVTILTSSRARADRHRAALQGVRFLEKASD